MILNVGILSLYFSRRNLISKFRDASGASRGKGVAKEPSQVRARIMRIGFIDIEIVRVSCATQLPRIEKFRLLFFSINANVSRARSENSQIRRAGQ